METRGAAWGAGLWCCFVPASTTWLLQPLDTHCFSRYKALLRKRAAEAFIDLSRDPKAEDVADVVSGVIRTVMQGNCWKRAFRETGWCDNQERISQYVRGHVAFDPVNTPVGQNQPTRETIAHVLHRGYQPDLTVY